MGKSIEYPNGISFLGQNWHQNDVLFWCASHKVGADGLGFSVTSSGSMARSFLVVCKVLTLHLFSLSHYNPIQGKPLSDEFGCCYTRSAFKFQVFHRIYELGKYYDWFFEWNFDLRWTHELFSGLLVRRSSNWATQVLHVDKVFEYEFLSSYPLWRHFLHYCNFKCFQRKIILVLISPVREHSKSITLTIVAPSPPGEIGRTRTNECTLAMAHYINRANWVNGLPSDKTD